MPRKKKEPFTFESNIEKISEKVKEKPKRVMSIIAGNLVKEIRATTLMAQFKQRYKILSNAGKSKKTGKQIGGLQWAWGWDSDAGKKNKTEIQIGFKQSAPGLIGEIMNGKDPIKPVVIKNIQNIQDTLTTALDEIRKE